MRKLIILIIFLSISCSSYKDEQEIEIYEAKISQSDILLMLKNDCKYCFDAKKIAKPHSPLLSKKEIKHFDYKNQTIYLTEKGKQKVKDLSIPLRGKPMILTLNGEIIYGFWFWNVLSSFVCDRVYTYPRMDFKLEFGLPYESSYGEDPRYDDRLKN